MRNKNENPWDWNIDQFNKLCQQSGASAYDQFKELLSYLENSSTLDQALKFFHQLKNYFLELGKTKSNQEILSVYHFHISSLTIDKENSVFGTLSLLQLPSTFTPEEWSFTFYEGIARYPIGEFEGKSVCELGCGIGWITIAIASQFRPEKIYGFDINPKAITCSKLNLFLNGYNDQGQIKKDADGKTLFSRAEFHTSDLLEYCKENQITLDRILGCIPQVLGPDPELIAHSIISENNSDEFLHSLSNYCGKQGYIEDQFGLGLIAKSLEQGVEILKSSGKIILNLGGRPGSAMLDQLFLRRGFYIKKVWQKKVEQASDTDIKSLVEIEKNSPHRFEFFMGPNSIESISAKTASHYQKSGGRIYHSLTVYDAFLRNASFIKRIMQLLSEGPYQEAKNAMDLNFKNPLIADEKVIFLATLADYLRQVSYFPYGPESGENTFRQVISSFMKNYFHVHFDPSHVIITPSRSALIKNLMLLFRSPLTLITKDLAKELQQNNEKNSDQEILECPRSTHLICDLIKALRPQLIAVSLTPQECLYPEALMRLISASSEIKANLIVDISQAFELTSTPQSSVNGIFEYLSRHTLPDHVLILCGLIHNKVYQDLEIAFSLTANTKWVQLILNMAEMTYCRPPVLTQLYYQTLFEELLKFQMDSDVRPPSPDQNSKQEKKREREREGDIFSQWKEENKLHPAVLKSFTHPALQSEKLIFNELSIRLDYGENELNSPLLLKSCLMESFIRQNISMSEIDPTAELQTFLKLRFGLLFRPNEHFLYSHGVTPLFSALMEGISKKNDVLIMPEGTYGYFVAIAQFFNIKIIFIPTKRDSKFKITLKDLQKSLSQIPKDGPRPWLFLNAPIVNPTGMIYSQEEVFDLLSVINLYKGKVILDTIFSGLEHTYSHSSGTRSLWNLDQHLKTLPAQEGKFGGVEFVILNGISKEFAGAGIRFGFAYTRDQEITSLLKENLGSLSPHSTTMYMIKKFYAHLNSHQPELISHQLEQRRTLQTHAKKLGEALKQYGWNPLLPEGGLFMVATPTQQLLEKISMENLATILFEKKGLLINSPEWTGISGYFRFVISVDEKKLDKAIKLLKEFFEEMV